MGVSSNPTITFPTVRIPQSRPRNSQATRTSAQSDRALKKSSFNFVAVLHPNLPYGSQPGVDSTFKKMFTPTKSKMVNFVDHAKRLGLVFNINATASSSDRPFQTITLAIATHFERQGLALGFATTPTSHCTSWNILYAGKKSSSDDRGALLTLYDRPPQHLMYKELQKITGRWAKYADEDNETEPIRHVIFIGMFICFN
ncbi:hypothetical protein C0992_010154 [Termitomyces sp. T32_za158]|nr:hypothetical protein C0992_010154 [Termitomyces sp. T32_za158]